MLLFVGAIAIGAYTASVDSKYENEYKAEISKIDAEIDKLENKIDKIYASDPRIEATEKEIELAENELKSLKAELSDADIYTEIGTNNLIVYCTLYNHDGTAFIDGVERGAMNDIISLYYLDPGEHTFFVAAWNGSALMDTEDVVFSVNGTNKYVSIKHDFRTFECTIKTYDTYEDFAKSFNDPHWMKEKLLKYK